MLKADFQADDLTIFKRFRVIFSLKKKNYPISAFVQFLFSTKKSPKVVNLPLNDETLCLTFWCHKQDKWLFNFQSYHQIVMYLYNSLAKSCTLFWKYS